MKELLDISSYRCSKAITQTYSTSFSLGIRLIDREFRPAVYAIYGFVRYADEIVDTLTKYDRKILMKDFEEEYHKALERKVSLNPVLNAFQHVVHKYGLYELSMDFLKSMKMDLDEINYESDDDYKNYIHGSANVVGLMCLKIFTRGDRATYERLEGYAIRMGSAFQKVNFLRDAKDDFKRLGRSYFPNISGHTLDEDSKKEIIAEIECDFKEASSGVLRLPKPGRLGVYVAYKYYLGLLKRLKKQSSAHIMQHRVRVPNSVKFTILLKAYIRFKLGLLS